jgi:CelD/BcsL family acetyltransferase involved in cellulose biosynthesis
LATLGHSKRQLARKFLRQLGESARISVRVIDDVSRWNEGFDAFHQLHQKRRTSVGDAGCFATAEFGRFLNDAGRSLLGAGRAVMLILDIEGQPAAAEYNLLGTNTVYFYQAGIDPDFLAHQPGHMLTVARIERVIRRGYRAVDFLRGDEPYKAHWRAQPRPQMNLRIVRRQVAAQLRHQAWKLQQGARKLARTGLDAVEQFGRKMQSLGGNWISRNRREMPKPNPSTSPAAKE